MFLILLTVTLIEGTLANQLHNRFITGDEFAGAASLCSEAIEFDTRYRGDPVRGIKNYHLDDVFSAEDCQVKCQEDDDCNYWVWNQPDFKNNPNTCWPKAGKGDVLTGKKGAKRISGPRSCVCPEEWEFDTRYRSDPVRGIKNFHLEDVFSAEDCQVECQEDDDCNYWVWNQPDFKRNPNTCWLKAGKGDILKGRKGKKRISGPKSCGPSTITTGTGPAGPLTK